MCIRDSFGPPCMLHTLYRTAQITWNVGHALWVNRGLPDSPKVRIRVRLRVISSRQYLSYDACLEVKSLEDNQNCISVLCCVRQLYTTIRTQIRAVLWTRWFCHTGPISLCIDLCLYFECFCFTLHSCYIIVSMVETEWTWWDWSLVFRNKLPSVLWHCWLGRLICKNPSPIWPIMCLVGR